MPERAAKIFATVMCSAVVLTSLMGVLALAASIGEAILRGFSSMRVTILLVVLSQLACELPPPRACHLQQVQVQYLPAHPCTKWKVTDGGLVSYQGFCPEECKTVTTCTLWCDEVDTGKVEKHLPHPTTTLNLGSNSIRCNDQGQLLF